MSEASKGTALKKDRQRCHQASRSCRDLLREFERACPASWVSHFIRKHNFQRYKHKLIEEGINIADKNALGDDKV
ncbi:unnamed protein product [Haemonchus placei]|uniref:HTH_48 domain-containing protein n=1 Tax=Haemonchus placei TaxID=6290 RepID=A0A0N4WUZ7_HAEPC|nr:unnamed protein product [Haemonchus placei]